MQINSIKSFTAVKAMCTANTAYFMLMLAIWLTLIESAPKLAI